MKLVKNTKGISKLLVLLLLVVSFLLGAVLSYIWTMGFYASGEFNLPRASISIEDVQFNPENATFFHVTVLNPSYSRSDAIVDRIIITTLDGKVHSVASSSPMLPLILAPGKSQTVQGFWDWSLYINQVVDVNVIIVGGSGAVFQAKTAFMNLTLTNVIFEPEITSTRFNVTMQSMGSPVSVDINKITINEAEISTLTPALPYQLNPNTSVTFTLLRDWTFLQNKTVSVVVQTKQGYSAFKSVVAPEVKLNLSNITFFNTTATSFFFNVTIQNSAISPAKVNVNLVTVYFDGQNITIETVDPSLPQALEPDSSLLLTCTWDWNPFKDKNVTVTVYTAQGFRASTEITVRSTP